MTAKATPLRATMTLLLYLLLFARAASVTTGSATARPFVPTETTNKECLDDPTFRLRNKKRKKNGVVVRKTCAWLKKVGAKKRDRICKANIMGKKGKRVIEGCPVTCGSCQDEILDDDDETDDDGCPLDAPGHGSACSVKQKGITCNYNFIYEGCVPEDLVCAPIKFCTCETESQTWSVLLEDAPLCKEPPTELAGHHCDPQDFCPPTPPESGSGCASSTDANLNFIRERGCHYNYVFWGCSFDSGVMCTAIDHSHCTEEGEWQTSSVVPLPCPDANPPDRGVPMGEACAPCPSVEPAAPFCPPKEPQDGDDCSLYSIDEVCNYDFTYQGCSRDELKCSPETFYTCVEDEDRKMWKHASIDRVFCPPRAVLG
mmetsp:Transcript_23862/g.49029  ORF Transcript_23862/g.49029 Transcript_23862/m.49029 type:complete len:372 (+) Transcript_23862:537-1652(+)